MTQRAAGTGLRKRQGRPKKDLLTEWASRPGAGKELSHAQKIYINWWGVYENSRQQLGLGDRKAKGAANKFVAHRHSLSVKQVRNIVREGNEAESRLMALGEFQGEKLEAQFLACRQMYRVIDQALSVLSASAYRDLLAQCSMMPRVKRPTPIALGAFTSSEEATSPDSLQKLAAVLAEAFLRANEALAKARRGQTQKAANEKFPEYLGLSRKGLSEIKPPQKR